MLPGSIQKKIFAREAPACGGRARPTNGSDRGFARSILVSSRIMNMYERCGYAVELVVSHRPVGGRWETRSVFHGKQPGSPKANCPQIHRPQVFCFLFFGFSVPGSVVRSALGTLIPWGSVERRTLFSTTTRTVAWAVSPHFCKDGYERECCC